MKVVMTGFGCTRVFIGW